jgi:hypothetical protein
VVIAPAVVAGTRSFSRLGAGGRATAIGEAARGGATTVAVIEPLAGGRAGAAAAAGRPGGGSAARAGALCKGCVRGLAGGWAA